MIQNGHSEKKKNNSLDKSYSPFKAPMVFTSPPVVLMLSRGQLAVDAVPAPNIAHVLDLAPSQDASHHQDDMTLLGSGIRN